MTQATPASRDLDALVRSMLLAPLVTWRLPVTIDPGSKRAQSDARLMSVRTWSQGPGSNPAAIARGGPRAAKEVAMSHAERFVKEPIGFPPLGMVELDTVVCLYEV